jgi:hypothetical protein
MVGESMAATMNVGLHENRNENLHGEDKSRNSFGMERPTKDQLNGFMVAP